VSGRAVDDRGVGIANVSINLVGKGLRGKSWHVTSGSDGAFVIRGLPAGTFTVHATHHRYLLSAVESDQGRSREVTIGVANRPTLLVRLELGGVITGRVVDEQGQPLSDVLVRAFGSDVQGRVDAKGLAGRSYRSNDLGVYRIANLPPGKYYVGVVRTTSGSPDAGRGLAPSWYPGSTDSAEARPVEVTAGFETPDIDVPIMSVRLTRVGGRALTQAGGPAAGAEIRLLSQSRGPSLASLTARVAADGRFAVRNVPSGVYEVKAIRQPSGRGDAHALEFARDVVTVSDEGTPDLTLMLTPAPVVRGRVILPNHLPEATPFSILALSEDADLLREYSAARVSGPGGTFGLPLIPGKYLFRLQGLPDGYVLESVTIGEHDHTNRLADVTASGLELAVTLSQRGATIVATASAAHGDVVLVNTLEATWSPAGAGVVIRPLVDGSAQLSGLPPGEYSMALVDSAEGIRRFDRRLLRQVVQRGARVDIDAGQHSVLKLTPLVLR
jgi:hypothetical protein